MVKILFAICVCCGALFGDVLESKIKNLIGENNYQTNANFINKIFANKNSFYSFGRLDIAKVIYSLKNNGLLSSKFGQPTEVKLSFSARTNPVLLAKIINDLLTNMGYSYFIITKAEFNNNLSTMEFSFNTEHSPDAGLILDNLARRGFVCLDIDRISQKEWIYSLEANEPQLPNVKYISKNTDNKLRESSGEYWISLSAVGELHIQPIELNKWNPRVVLYDKHLNIVNIVANTSPKSYMNIKIPNGVRFVMISDYDTAEALRGGINLTLR